jgi:hypothetical protein
MAKGAQPMVRYLFGYTRYVVAAFSTVAFRLAAN